MVEEPSHIKNYAQVSCAKEGKVFLLDRVLATARLKIRNTINI
jgi:hypothetical protein